MPPKTSTKTEQKAKAKIIEDKTFGLKNKNKSTKVNKYIQQVEAQVKNTGTKNAKKAEDVERERREQRKLEEQQKAELAQIYKPVVQQKVPFGVDPKTVLCAFFKVGQCTKGDKCKFSHDLNVERKSAKINVYADSRDEKDEQEADTMDTWDQDKLEQVVTKKHGPGIRTTTDIVCKYFLEAIENRKYGWFWECPNGGNTCKYRHALPPGFILKSAIKAAEREREEEDQISLEEFLETERYKIAKITPVTAESFAKWKTDRKRSKTREAEYRAGKLAGMVSGRDLFVFNPDLFKDDEEAMDVDYSKREEEDEGDNNGTCMVGDESLFLQEDLEDLDISEDEDEDEEEN
jgi:hypothetical protein